MDFNSETTKGTQPVLWYFVLKINGYSTSSLVICTKNQWVLNQFSGISY